MGQAEDHWREETRKTEQGLQINIFIIIIT